MSYIRKLSIDLIIYGVKQLRYFSHTIFFIQTFKFTNYNQQVSFVPLVERPFAQRMLWNHLCYEIICVRSFDLLFVCLFVFLFYLILQWKLKKLDDQIWNPQRTTCCRINICFVLEENSNKVLFFSDLKLISVSYTHLTLPTKA